MSSCRAGDAFALKQTANGRQTTDREGYLLFVQVASSREAPHSSWAQEVNMHAVPLEIGPK